MANDSMISTSAPTERALLVGAQLKGGHPAWDIEDSLLELAQLAQTAGLEVAGQTWQFLSRYNPATLIGSGKIDELVDLRQDLECSVVVFDDELSPRQLRNIEEKLGEEVKLLDRTSLILDIFAQHAHTREGQLQVELAQYEYRLPRLTRAWTHLARQAGGGAARGGAGGVGLRGPGETQLEVDRREIGRRIAKIRQDLEQVRRHRALHRRQRKRTAVPVVAIVGYTNAGKSTLLHALSDADVLVEDKLFATLDPTTRRVSLPSGREALFTDTVGFIRKLPTELVAAFRATLEEIREADLIMHVLDIAHPNAHQHQETVNNTLADIGAEEKPVVLALNKVDLLGGQHELEERLAEFPEGRPISAAEGQGLDALLNEIEAELSQEHAFITVCLPYDRGDLAALFHEKGQVDKVVHQDQGTVLEGRLSRRWLDAFGPFLV
jgi:GTP-binding protein HflX